MPPPTSLLTRFLDLPGARRALIGGAAGTVGGAVESLSPLMSDFDPKLKGMNTLLGGATGAIAGAAGRAHPAIALGALASWVPKQLAMLGVNTGKKYVDIQQPIAETNLRTAALANETARIQQEAAKRLSASDIARLGLAAAGAAGVGGLGYYLYKTIGPGKKKPAPKVTVNFQGGSKEPGDIQVEGDADTLALSERLYKSLRRDTRRSLRDETNDNIRHEPKRLKDKRREDVELSKSSSYGILLHSKPDTAAVRRNIAEILSCL